MVDTDVQASANYWAQLRDEAGIKPRVACIQKLGKGLQAEIQDLARRYEDIIIDAGGRDSVELRASLVVAERVFIPIQPSQFDIWTLSRMDELVQTAKAFNPDIEAHVVLSKASPNPSVTEQIEAKEAIADFEHMGLTNTIIRDRIAYRKAAREGVCIAELKVPDPKAIQEIQSLFQEVFS